MTPDGALEIFFSRSNSGVTDFRKYISQHFNNVPVYLEKFWGMFEKLEIRTISSCHVKGGCNSYLNIILCIYV